MLTSLVNLLIPARCRGCGTQLDEGEDELCLKCLAHLPRSHYFSQGSPNPVETRLAGQLPFERATSWLLYSHDSMVSSLIQDFKYRNAPHVAERLGELMALELLPTGFLSDVDTIIPTPQHWLRRLKRGYNQTEYIARGISKVTGAEIKTNLRAERTHKSQTRVSTEQRIANARGVYGVRHPEELRGRHILLVDDVCTTGSTLVNCGKALYQTEDGFVGEPLPFRLTILALAATF